MTDGSILVDYLIGTNKIASETYYGHNVLKVVVEYVSTSFYRSPAKGEAENGHDNMKLAYTRTGLSVTDGNAYSVSPEVCETNLT